MGTEKLALSAFNLQRLCIYCEKPLSVGPVFITSNDGERIKCGRCKDVPSIMNVRNIVYEEVAAQLKFPCCYKMCNEKVSWNEARKHEQFCLKRTLYCIGFNCEKLVILSDLQNHFESCTSVTGQKIFKNKLQNYVLTIGESCRLFLKQPKISFLFFWSSGSKGKSTVGVFSLNPLSEILNFTLTVTGGVKTPFISYQGNVLEYDDIMHCPHCLQKNCKIVNHTLLRYYYSNAENSKLIQIDINENPLRLLFGTQVSISLKITNKVELIA